MFPPGLKAPPPDAFRDSMPSDAPPAGYPSRVPFLVNQAVSFAETDDLASCIWQALPAGVQPVEAPKRSSRPEGVRGAVSGVLDAIDMAVDLLKPDPTIKALLDDVFERVLAAAAESGWTLIESAPAPFPVGSRYATLTRPGERMQVMAIQTPSSSAVTASSFADRAA